MKHASLLKIKSDNETSTNLQEKLISDLGNEEIWLKDQDSFHSIEINIFEIIIKNIVKLLPKLVDYLYNYSQSNKVDIEIEVKELDNTSIKLKYKMSKEDANKLVEPIFLKLKENFNE